MTTAELALTQPPVALTVAGSDCSGGAGIQADLKSFAAAGAYGLSAVTCVVAEVPGKVTGIEAITPKLLEQQIALLLKNFPVGAMKTGMLFSASLVETTVAAWQAAAHRPPMVVDPVMVATSGDPLLQPDAISSYRDRLLPLATLITPNVDEAAVLLGRRLTCREDLAPAAQELAAQFGTAVLVKGGHLRGEEAVDVLAERDGRVTEFSAPFYPGVETHGTGCTYSAAITARLARGENLRHAVAGAKAYLTEAIRTTCRWGKIDALNHSGCL